MAENEKPQPDARFPCAVCGAMIKPDVSNRCEECRRFACRNCLKIHYDVNQQGQPVVTRTLCYVCYHSIYEKPYQE